MQNLDFLRKPRNTRITTQPRDEFAWRISRLITDIVMRSNNMHLSNPSWEIVKLSARLGQIISQLAKIRCVFINAQVRSVVDFQSTSGFDGLESSGLSWNENKNDATSCLSVVTSCRNKLRHLIVRFALYVSVSYILRSPFYVRILTVYFPVYVCMCIE